MGRWILDKPPQVCAARGIELGMNEGGWGGLGCQVGIVCLFFWSLGAVEGCRARVWSDQSWALERSLWHCHGVEKGFPAGGEISWKLMQSSMYEGSGAVLSCVWLCDSTRCSPPGSSVHEIFQARPLEWAAICFSWGSSQPRDWTLVSCVSCIGRWILYHLATWGQTLIICSWGPMYFHSIICNVFAFLSNLFVWSLFSKLT